MSHEAPTIGLEAPQVDVLDDQTAGGVRTLRLNLRSPRGAPVMMLDVEPYGAVQAVVIHGKRLEAIGSYSGIRSRGLSLLTIKRLKRLAAARKSTKSTEFKTPLFGGGGGNRSYNLDCGNRNIMVGMIFKAGSWMDAIGIICQSVNPQNGELGSEFTRGPVGGSGGKARIKRCSNGKVVLFL